jgi:hypothetical protein
VASDWSADVRRDAVNINLVSPELEPTATSSDGSFPASGAHLCDENSETESGGKNAEYYPHKPIFASAKLFLAMKDWRLTAKSDLAVSSGWTIPENKATMDI